MVDKMEMSLDDIILKNKPSYKVGSGGNRGSGFRFRKNSKPWQRNGVMTDGLRYNMGGNLRRGGIQKAKNFMSDINKPPAVFGSKRLWSSAIGGLPSRLPYKMLITNLDYGVTDMDIYELFEEFGNIRTASIHYDKSGRSLGTASVTFDRRSDALKAFKQYNGVPLDGRPMRMHISDEDSKEPQSFPEFNYLRRPKRTGREIRPNRQNKKSDNDNSRMQMTADELDAELEAYANNRK